MTSFLKILDVSGAAVHHREHEVILGSLSTDADRSSRQVKPR